MKNSYFFYILLLLNTFNTFGQTENKIHDFLLGEMTDSIAGNHYPGVHSVLISRDKQLVYE